YPIGNNLAVLTGVYWASIVVLVLFTAGVWTRLTAVLAWVIVVSFSANPAAAAEADALMWMLAFYLMIGYVLLDQRGKEQSVFSRILGPALAWPLRTFVEDNSEERPPSLGANIAIRLLQVHLAVAVVASGLHKLQFGDWWQGLALWYPLHPPTGAAETN